MATLSRADVGRIALVVTIGSLVLAVHAYHYWPFHADDAFISLRYSERWLAGQGLTWTDGERVEGYSNLLWVLGCAAVGALGIELPMASLVLNALCSVALLTAVASQRPPRDGSAREFVPALVGVLLVALSGPVAVWVVGRLETVMVGALLAWSCREAFRLAETGFARSSGPSEARRFWIVAPCGGALGLLALTRPDAILFTPPLVALLVIVDRLRLRSLLMAMRLGAIPLLCAAGQLTFRWYYYHDWVPNTARAKVAWTAQRVTEGARYVTDGMETMWPALALAAVALLAAAFWKPARARVVLLLSLLLVWLGYQVVVGGDIFPGWRHLLEASVLLAMLATEGAAWIRERRPAIRCGYAWAATFAGATLLTLQLADELNRVATFAHWTLDGKAIGGLLRRQFGAERPLYAVDTAGCLPYFSGLPALDLLGLNDRYLATHPPENLGTGLLGHELGDTDYFIRRDPDIYHFGTPADHGNPKFLPTSALVRRPEFRERYRRIALVSREDRTTRFRLWFRTDSPRVGVRTTPDAVWVPGYLVAARDSFAVENADGRLAATVTRSLPGTIALDVPTAGEWTARVESRGVPLRVTLTANGRQVQGSTPSVRLAGPATVQVTIAPRGPGLAGVESLTLERATP